MAAAARRPLAGFTLIEVLVALSIMALLALMSWRGLDAMLRTAQSTQGRSTTLLGLQGGLTQWQTDLDRLMETPYVSAVDWDGRLLRVVRASPDGAEQALLVVGWTQQTVAGTPQWVRWQSAPLRQRAELQDAWQAVAAWSRQGSGPADRLPDLPADASRADPPSAEALPVGLPGATAVAVTPLQRWQLLYFRAGQWVPADTLAAASAGTGAGTGAGARASSLGDTPEGLRLVLSLPVGGPLQGELVSDWFNPLAGAVR